MGFAFVAKTESYSIPERAISPQYLRLAEERTMATQIRAITGKITPGLIDILHTYPLYTGITMYLGYIERVILSIFSFLCIVSCTGEATQLDGADSRSAETTDSTDASEPVPNDTYSSEVAAPPADTDVSDSNRDVAIENPGDLGIRETTLYGGPVEWSIQNSSYSQNPFDVIAKVTFTHRGSDETITTEMFYDGDDTWKFRFTATELGVWRFETKADGDANTTDDPQLDGHSGAVRVVENGDGNTHGFLDHDGNRWRWEGREDPFVPQLVMYSGHETTPEQLADGDAVEAAIDEFLGGHGFTGFQISMLSGYWFDAQAGGYGVEESMKNPDPETFRALEKMIMEVHDAGGMFHFWLWGDAQRGWTNKSLAGGINGKQDRRLQRYIAARLGPIPGWSAGYGFDLNEWVGASKLDSWNSYMQQRLGWHHYLGGRPVGPNSGTDHSPFNSWNDDLEYSSYEHHKPDYEVTVGALSELTNQPVLSEDRNRVRGTDGSGKNWTERQTRRGLWQTTMAGGMGNIWGQLHTDDTVGYTGVYDNKAQLKTYGRFWFEESLFISGLSRANDLSQNTQNTKLNDVNNDSNTRVLKAPGGRLILYRQDASRIHIDLSGLQEPKSAVAVNTRQSYSEIDLGERQPKAQTIELPKSSDWAVAIGDFTNLPGE